MYFWADVLAVSAMIDASYEEHSLENVAFPGYEL